MIYGVDRCTPVVAEESPPPASHLDFTPSSTHVACLMVVMSVCWTVRAGRSLAYGSACARPRLSVLSRRWVSGKSSETSVEPPKPGTRQSIKKTIETNKTPLPDQAIKEPLSSQTTQISEEASKPEHVVSPSTSAPSASGDYMTVVIEDIARIKNTTPRRRPTRIKTESNETTSRRTGRSLVEAVEWTKPFRYTRNDPDSGEILSTSVFRVQPNAHLAWDKSKDFCAVESFSEAECSRSLMSSEPKSAAATIPTRSEEVKAEDTGIEQQQLAAAKSNEVNGPEQQQPAKTKSNDSTTSHPQGLRLDQIIARHLFDLVQVLATIWGNSQTGIMLKLVQTFRPFGGISLDLWLRCGLG